MQRAGSNFNHAQWLLSGSLRHPRLIELRWADEEEGKNKRKEAGEKIGFGKWYSFLAVVSREANSPCPDPLDPAA